MPFRIYKEQAKQNKKRTLRLERVLSVYLYMYTRCEMNVFTKWSELFLHISQVVVYYDTARKQSKKHKSALASVLVDGCPANTSVIHTPEIVVPPAPATDVVASKIIHITYELKVIFPSYILPKNKNRNRNDRSFAVLKTKEWHRGDKSLAPTRD